MPEGRMGKSELVQALSENLEGFTKSDIRVVLDEIASIAQEEIAAGYDFEIPNVCRITYAYTTPRKKGEEYINPITKETLKAEKARPAKIRLRASIAKRVKDKMPTISSKAGKAVVARKG